MTYHKEDLLRYIDREFGNRYEPEIVGMLKKYADKVWDRAQKMGEPPEDTFDLTVGILGDVDAWLMEARERGKIDGWLRKLYSKAKFSGALPTLDWYVQQLARLAVYAPEPQHKYLRDLLLKTVARNDSHLFHLLLPILVNTHGRTDLRSELDSYVGSVLRSMGKEKVPRCGVREVGIPVVLAYAAHLHTGDSIHNALKKLEEDWERWRKIKGIGGSIRLEIFRKIPSLLLASGFALRRMNHPLYVFLSRAVALGAGKEFMRRYLLTEKGSILRHFDTHVTVSGEGGSITIHLSKFDPVVQLMALEAYPTCLHPLYGQLGTDYLLTAQKNGIIPLIVAAEREGRIIGRVTTFWDTKYRNVYITSASFGRIGVAPYIDAIEDLAKKINKDEGRKVFERIIVGNPQGHRFRLDYPGVHDTFAWWVPTRKAGYVRGVVVRKL